MNPSPISSNEPRSYPAITEEWRSLINDERDWLVNLANCVALLFHALPQLNWAGFYLHRNSQLLLGPFQGKPACMRIDLGRGVCGTAAIERRTVIVPDVHQFPGHIACDTASQSEIVVPLILGDRLLGVLDLDSPIKSRFDEADARGLENIVTLLLNGTDWP